MKSKALLFFASVVALTLFSCTDPSSGAPPPVNWTISFDANGNEDVTGSMDSLIVADGSSFDVPDCAFSRELFTFSYWVTTLEVPEPGNPEPPRYYPNDTIEAVGANIVLYAVWTDNPRTVSFDAAGGTGSMDSVSVPYNDPYALPDCGFTFDGYTFMGWQDGDGVSRDVGYTFNVTSDAVFTAIWFANPVISFNAGGSGSTGSMPSVSVPYNGSVTLPECGFAREGYTFLRWQDGDGVSREVGYEFNATSDVEFTAIWAANPVISFNAGGSGSAGSMPSVSVPYNGTFTVPACVFTRAGYTFSRWIDGGGVERLVDSTIASLTADITLTALWNQNPTISFNSGGADGGSMSNTSVAYGGSYTLPDCGYTRTRYDFLHWRDGNGLTYQPGTPVVLTSNITFTAVWQIVPRITFHPNGQAGTAPVTGAMESVIVQYGNYYAAPPSGYARKTFHFTGWNTAANGGGTSYSAGTSIGPITADLELYAVWNDNDNVIKYIGFDEGLDLDQLFDTVEDDGNTVEIVSDAPSGADGMALRAQLDAVHLLDAKIRGGDHFDDFWLVYNYYLEYTNGVGETFPGGAHVPLVIILDSASAAATPPLIGTPLFNNYEYADPVVGLPSIRTLTNIEGLTERVLGHMHAIGNPAGTWHRVKIHVKTDASLAGASITFDGEEWAYPAISVDGDDGVDPDVSFDTLRLWYHVPDFGPLFPAQDTVLYFDDIGVYAQDPDNHPD